MAEFFPVVFYEMETVGLLSSLELLLETLKHPCEQLREEAAKIELAGVLSRYTQSVGRVCFRALPRRLDTI